MLLFSTVGLAIAALVIAFESQLVSLFEGFVQQDVEILYQDENALPDISRFPRPHEIEWFKDKEYWVGGAKKDEDPWARGLSPLTLEARRLGRNSAVYRFDPAVGDVRMVCNIANEGPNALEQLELFMLLPRDSNRQSIIDLVLFSEDKELLTDNRGQSVVAYSFDNIAAGETLNTGWRARSRTWALYYEIDPGDVGSLAEAASDVAHEFLDACTQTRGLSPLPNGDFLGMSHPAVISACEAALQGETNPWLMAERIFEWVQSNIEYRTDSHWAPVPDVIERGTGSCSEFTFTFIALCRASGIPARWCGALARGGPARGPGPYRDNTHHRWAEVYLPRIGWTPCDVAGGTWAFLPNPYLVISQSSGESDLLGLNYDIAIRSRNAPNDRGPHIERYALWYSHPDSFYVVTAQVRDFTEDGRLNLRVNWAVLGEKEEADKTLTLQVLHGTQTLAQVTKIDPAEGIVEVTVDADSEMPENLQIKLFRTDNRALSGGCSIPGNSGDTILNYCNSGDTILNYCPFPKKHQSRIHEISEIRAQKNLHALQVLHGKKSCYP